MVAWLFAALKGWLWDGNSDAVSTHGYLAAGLTERVIAEPRTLPCADGHALQIGQSEVNFAIAAKAIADDLKQLRVLSDRHHLALAERPALRRVIEAEDGDLPDVSTHVFSLRVRLADRFTRPTERCKN